MLNSFNSVGSSIRRSGSNTTISTSRLINNASGQMRLSSRNQLDQNPQKPSAKEINVANAERK